MAEKISIPTEQLIVCSNLVNRQVGFLEERGYSPYDDRAVDTVLKVMQRVVPDLMALYQMSARVESNGLFQRHDGEARYFDSGSFVGKLGGISIEKILREEHVDFLGADIALSSYDLTLIFEQEIIDPDPVDLGYSNEIVVPLLGIERLEAAV